MIAQPTAGYDCIIIGGGPSGSTVGTLLADFGHRVLILEQGKFPRHHIGESLMPHTYWVFKRLGMLEKMNRSPFPRKESVQFVSANGQESQPFFFPDRDPNEWSTTWQVRRDLFDQMMLDNAAEHGAEVRLGVRVKEVLFDGDRAVGVRAVVDGRPTDIPAKVVIDASGVCGLLSKQLGIRVGDPGLKNAAIYAYYKDAFVDEGRNAGATIVIHTPNKMGWFWFIPLPDRITSIGIVAPPSCIITGRGDDPLATLEQEIEDCPSIAKRIVGAKRVSGSYVTSDFTYRSRQLAGNGWVMVGDAFCFLDPIYSSGVMLALQSGAFAADAIHDALGADDVSGKRLGVFGQSLVNGIHAIRRLVYTYYDREFSFAKFMKARPHCHDPLVRTLIGDVFHDENEVLFEHLKDFTTLPDNFDLDRSRN